MCGRFSLTQDIAEFLRELGLSVPPELAHPRQYNIAPSQPVLGVVADPVPRLMVMEWGFLPAWAKPESDTKPVINARGETVAEKPFFRGAFRSARCALLADGFYEWKRTGTQKQPYRITLQGGNIFAMAGLWSARMVSDGSEQITCAVVTTGPNELMRPIHDRMPVILDGEAVRVWMDPGSSPEALADVMRPVPDGFLTRHPVSTTVNSARNDSPECIRAIALADGGPN